jgi:hypothetical protein
MLQALQIEPIVDKSPMVDRKVRSFEVCIALPIARRFHSNAGKALVLEDTYAFAKSAGQLIPQFLPLLKRAGFLGVVK